METSIYCMFEDSKLKNNFVVCKHCQFVTIKPQNNVRISRVCPVLLERASQHPSYPQITLDKVTVMKQDGTVVSEQTIENNKGKTFIVNDWWFGEASPALKPMDPIPQTPPNQNKKQCSQEQIDERMEICKGCEFYQNNTCLKCGCALSRERNYMNKLLWADQSCPVNKWGPVSTSS